MIRRVYHTVSSRPLLATTSLLGIFLAWYLHLLHYPQNATVAQDELWAATLSALSFFNAFVFILRFDIHPPLYYMQLNIWSWVSQSDAWLQLNSILWLMASAVVVVKLVKHHSDSDLAYLAGAFVLSSPYLVYYGFELRMYTLLAFLTILGVWFTERLMEDPSRRHWIAVFLTYVAAAYTHALAPLVIPCHFVYGVLYARRCKRDTRFLIRWVGFTAFVSVLALPIFVNSMLRSDNHAAKPTFSIVCSTLTQLLVGTPLSDITVVGVISLIMVVVALIYALFRVDSRHLLVAYFVMPVVALLVMSYALRPVWLARPFLFSLPIIGVAFGRAACTLSEESLISKQWLGGITAVLVGLQVAVVFHEVQIPKTPDYAALTDALRPLVKPGDAIVVLERAEIFWGVARYYAGPEWGDGLRVSVPPSENWARILNKLPAPIRAYLTRVDRFEYRGIQFIGGHPADLGSFNHVFFVGYTTDAVPPDWRDAPVVAINADVTAYGPLPKGVH